MKIPAGFWIAVAGSIAVEASLVFWAWRTGVLIIPFFGIFIVPLLLLLHTGIGWLLKRFRADSEKVVLVQKSVWCLATIGSVALGWIEGTPKGAFRRLVTSPIPNSVEDIHWNGLAGINGRFLVTFQSAPDDVFQIIRQRGFEPDTNSWWYGDPDRPGDTDSRSKNVNDGLANECRMLKVPFEQLYDPEVFKQKGRDWNNSQGLYLITDRQRKKVYVVLRWG